MTGEAAVAATVVSRPTPDSPERLAATPTLAVHAEMVVMLILRKRRSWRSGGPSGRGRFLACWGDT